MSILKIENLKFTYGKKTPFEKLAVNDISFEINTNEIVGIIGHTGSGKSTLMQMLNGLINPDEGTIYFNNKNIWSDKKFIRSVRFDIGLVFQYPEYQLFEETVEKDIAYGPSNMGLSKEEIAERVAFAAEIVALQDELLQKSPFDLSGGEKRRAALAGVIAMKPKIIILDEPTAGLDPHGRNKIMRNLKAYKEREDITMIIVSHSMEEIAEMCSTVYVLNEGKVALSGSVEDVYTQVELLRSFGLDVPVVTDIANRLRQSGFDIPQVHTLDAAEAAIMQLISNRGGKHD